MSGKDFFNPELNKKSVNQPNQVKITPEQRAQTSAAKNNEELTRGLSGGGNQSPDKGLSVETSQSGRVYTGNGITRITNPDGSVEFEIDHSKYNGQPQIFAKGTKVTHINEPKKQAAESENWFNKMVENVNDWGKQISDGHIRGLGDGLRTFATVLAAPVAFLTSCETHEPDYIRKDFDVTTETTFNTDYTVVKPKDTKETAEYKLEVLENDTENKYHHETEDGVFYEYEVDTETYQKPYIILADGTKLDIDYDALEKSIDGKTVVNYINALGEEKEYTFSADTTGVTVVTADFGNGFTHHIGNNTDITPDTPLGVAYENFAKVGLMKNDGDLKTNIDANQGSYDTKPGFKMELMPGEISDVINNPTVKGNIGDIEFEGPMTKNGDDIVIKNKNGDEIRLTYKQNYDVGNGSEPDLYDGLLVSVNGKEAYIVADHGDGSTDIGKIDRENGTTVQHYGNQNESFDLDLPKQADEYYNEKYTNLDNARKEAHVDYYSIPVPPDIDNRSEEHKLKVHTEGYVRAY